MVAKLPAGHDYGSVAISGAAGGLGAFAGGAAAGRFQIPFPVLGQPLSVVSQSSARSAGIISSGAGGVVGGVGDVYGNSLYYGR